MKIPSQRRYLWIYFGLLLGVMVISYLAHTMMTPRSAKPIGLDDQAGTDYVSVRDTDGNLILQTGLPVTVNDEFISTDDIHYIITGVKGNQAVAHRKLPDEIGLGTSNKSQPAATLYYPNSLILRTSGKKLAIYHTHNDESYILTSGKAAEPPDGDILNVGDVMAEALRRSGFTIVHNKNNHNPHDINAYNRSRRTAVQLLKDSPDAVFDIHRDSAPLKSYLTTINGVETAQVMIVIGRSNPNMSANLEFARQVKATADQLYPGLMRGIYMGRGSYNQDLYPRALLFEIGTDKGSLTIASNAARLISDVITAVLGQE
ncbi:MAG TPA: stage II sporulation protein P [Syntrophomonadaceae bacterium]|nr:stage II sporulation protein P [Syntrophomonadaceae bacterium]HQD90329.1 stage II sporulation protein P [Syntrophomonadaceae bacterium]